MKRPKIDAAVRDLSSAQVALGRARKRLARATHPGDPAVLVARQWSWAVQLIKARGPRLARIKGVVGYGLGRRIRSGVQLQQPCLTVYVVRKLSKSELRRHNRRVLPSFLRADGRTLPIDVVEFGRLERHALAGSSIGPAGRRIKGTIGSFAIDTTNTPVAITAMHVAGLPQAFTGPLPRISFTVPSTRDDAKAPVFGHLLGGTMRDVDAAKISVLDAANALFAFPRIGPIRGWRPVVYPGDEGTFVRMYGATSKYQTGHIVTTSTDMPGDDLAEAIVVSIHSEEGDSGAAIVDRENLVLGFLVGRNTSTADHLRIFCPASPVLDRLSCDIPTQS